MLLKVVNFENLSIGAYIFYEYILTTIQKIAFKFGEMKHYSPYSWYTSRTSVIILIITQSALNILLSNFVRVDSTCN